MNETAEVQNIIQDLCLSKQDCEVLIVSVDCLFHFDCQSRLFISLWSNMSPFLILYHGGLLWWHSLKPRDSSYIKSLYGQFKSNDSSYIHICTVCLRPWYSSYMHVYIVCLRPWDNSNMQVYASLFKALI